MNKEDFLFMLEDRICKIRSINEQYNLESNSYISFSGGKDSTILHYLIDLALPNNKIPRVYANTGIEYNLMVKFVKDLSSSDNRIIILNQNKNIVNTLNKFGYPFKSKEHSLRVEQFNLGHYPFYIKKYITGIDKNGNITNFKCPNSLLYQFKSDIKYNYSNKCCYLLKKDLVKSYVKSINKFICITGMRSSEGGNRTNLSCLTNNNKSFHPLIVCDEQFEDYFIKYFNIKLCDLYYSPYNFKRTGCKGCPFNLNLQEDLNILYKLLPNEYYQCLHLWSYVYDEYIRIGFRLKYYPHKKGVQFNIFDYER